MKLFFLCLCLSLAAGCARAEDAKITTVFLVRHAEKNPHPAGGDAGLSAKGQLRAAELARVLGAVHLEAVYATPFGRARMTAEAVARAQHDSVTVYDADHLERLGDRLRALPAGASVLVVGHADTLPGTYEALTGEAFPDRENVPYDKLYVLLLPSSGGHRLLTLRYGAAAE
jgi:broad specificity phosphatase PhoE